MIECESCGTPFDPVSTRWLCPECGRKHHCCDEARPALSEFVGEDTWVWPL